MRCVVSQKLTDISTVLTAAIIRATSSLMMEAARTSEMSANIYEYTRRNIPQTVTFMHAAVRT
jgi:hypothetical protein